MNGAPLSIRVRLDEIRQRIERAAVRSGRSPDQVRLVGASKTAPAEVLAEAIQLGLEDLGENRVQEAERKQLELGADGSSVRWHLIGPLQRNKVKKAVRIFDVVQSVNSLELAQEISRRACEYDEVIEVLVEVNVSDEPAKFGIAPDRVEALLEQIRPLPGLQMTGLMTIGRMPEHAEEARRDFAALRELRDRCERSLGLKLPELSMGMSGDFEVAIEEGATWVRVGTALFGTRS